MTDGLGRTAYLDLSGPTWITRKLWSFVLLSKWREGWGNMSRLRNRQVMEQHIAAIEALHAEAARMGTEEESGKDGGP